MLIDIGTMLAVLAASSLLMALTLWLAFPRSQDGLRKWAAGLVLQAGAWALFAAGGLSPDFEFVVAGNLLFSFGVALKAASLLEFQRSRTPLWLPLALPLTLAFFFLVLQQPRAQSLFNGLAYAVTFACMAWLMWRPPYAVSASLRWLMVITFAAAASGFLSRAILAVTLAESIAHPLSPGPLQAFIHLYSYIILISSSVGILLMHKERADEAARQLAAIDPLTGVYNRRIFMELADMALARARRTATPVSLLMLDLDHFKNVNDRHGHMVGDEVLKSFVTTAQICLRREDMTMRYGGEEFCIMLPGATLEGAVSLAERIRALVEETPIVAGEKFIHITASFGVASIGPGEEGSVAMLIERADTALYRAKAAGRNCVATAPAA